jgi:hypothetical protein
MGNSYCRFAGEPAAVEALTPDNAATFASKPLSNLHGFLMKRLNPQPTQTLEEVMRDGPIRDPRFGINSSERNAQRKHEHTYFRTRK